MKNVLFLSCCYLVKSEAEEDEEAKSEGEELSPGIKISELCFFSPSPPATFQLFLKYLAMSISK